MIVSTAVEVPVPEKEDHKFSLIIQAYLNVTADIVTNLHGNGYRKLSDITYFLHKDILEYRNNKNLQIIVHGGDNYIGRTMKTFQGLVWRASWMKLLDIAILVEDNNSSDLVEEWYNESIAEAAKVKKEFELDTPEKFTYSNWCRW